MRNVKRLFLAALPLVLSGTLIAGAADVQDVEKKIQDKVSVEQLQVRSEVDRVVLEGRVGLLRDKMQAEDVVRKEIKKKEVVNNIIVATSQKTDDDITLDVIAQIKRDSPNNFVFDQLGVETKGGNVTLSGRVRNAYLYDIAEEAAAKITGVRSVVNQIDVLPPSASDDRLRANILNKLRRDDRLFYYFLGAQPSIHIIVEGSRVTLVGYVDTKADLLLAGTLVRQMSGVLSVENLLKVD